MHITQSLSQSTSKVTFEVGNSPLPSLTLCIEAIDHLSQFAPESRAAASRLFCHQAKISQAKFAHIERLWLEAGR